jgi:ABC-2 type transport system permease protein
MNPVPYALRAGLARGWIELRLTFTNAQDVFSYVFMPVVFTVVMIFMRDSTVPGTDFSLGARTLPSVVGAGIAFGGMMNLVQLMTVEREDGTLLRSKAIPHGMLGYLVGRIVLSSGMALIGTVITLVPGLVLFGDGLNLSAGSWLMLIVVVLVGLVATLPLGAVLGSLFDNPRNIGAIVLPILGLVAISGIFYPISGFPQWLQWVAQVFPIYWLGLGMRSALLPAELAAVEIGGSWRNLETVGVLAGWAVLGLILAPIVLRRMARRESGSAMVERREKAMQRVV